MMVGVAPRALPGGEPASTRCSLGEAAGQAHLLLPLQQGLNGNQTGRGAEALQGQEL